MNLYLYTTVGTSIQYEPLHSKVLTSIQYELLCSTNLYTEQYEPVYSTVWTSIQYEHLYKYTVWNSIQNCMNLYSVWTLYTMNLNTVQYSPYSMTSPPRMRATVEAGITDVRTPKWCVFWNGDEIPQLLGSELNDPESGPEATKF